MSSKSSGHDWDLFIGTILVFALPLTVLIPGFSVWDFVPKVRVTRLHLFSYEVTWQQLNTIILSLIVVFFCMFLEIRKRKLDEMLANVLDVNRETEETLFLERDRQAAAMKTCVELLDASVEHYENLALFRDDLIGRKLKQVPPTIEYSSMDM